MKKDDYGLFIMVVGATDRAHHDWWKYIDPDHPAYDAKEAALYGDLILEVYKVADDCIGKFLAAVDDDTTVIVMSDHGGGAHPRWYFNTNYFLRNLGLLTSNASASKKGGLKGAFKHFYRTRIRRFAYLDAINWKQTKAYRFPMYPPVESVMINVVGRQPEKLCTARRLRGSETSRA